MKPNEEIAEIENELERLRIKNETIEQLMVDLQIAAEAELLEICGKMRELNRALEMARYKGD